MWQPRIPRNAGPIYREIADSIERAIAAGTLSGGSQLPTHPDLARRLGVTTLTAGRAYTEAARRGLIESTVGRGTFVLSDRPQAAAGEHGLDLSQNIIRGSEDL